MKKLLILSGKGGTGKTTVTSSFIHFEQAKYYADCDVDAPNLHLVMDEKISEDISQEQKVEGPLTIKDFIGSKKAYIDPDKCTGCGMCEICCRFHAIEVGEDTCKVNEFVCEGCGVCKFVCPEEAVIMQEDVAGTLMLYEGDTVFSTAKLKMGRGNSGKLVSEVKKALLPYEEEEQLAIIDGSPGTGCPVIASLSGVDLALVVTEPTKSGMSDLQRVLKTISLSFVKAAVCVNKYDIDEGQTEEIKSYCREQGIPYVGSIPYDKEVSKAVNKGICIAKTDSKARDAIYEIYQEVKKYL